MAKVRSQDLLGSLASGVSAGLKAYGGAKFAEGEQRRKSAEEEAKQQEAEEKERQKDLKERRRDLEFNQFRAAGGDPFAMFMVEQYGKFDAGRAFTKDEHKRLFEDFGAREAEEAGENERLFEAMQDTGVDPTEASAAFFGQFLEETGQAPADMGTAGGRAQVMPFVHEAQTMLPPISRTLEAVGMPGKDPLPVLLAGGRERAYKRKLAKAQEEQDIKAAVKPPKKTKPPVTKLQEKNLIGEAVKADRAKILSDAQEYIYQLEDRGLPTPPAGIKSRAGLKAAARWGVKLMKDKPGWFTGDEEAPDSTFHKMLEQYDLLGTARGRGATRKTLRARFPEIYIEDALTPDEDKELEELLRKAGG